MSLFCCCYCSLFLQNHRLGLTSFDMDWDDFEISGNFSSQPFRCGLGWFSDYRIVILCFNTKFDACLFQTINSIFLNVYIEGKMFWLDLVLYDFFIMLVWGRCRIFYSLGLFCTHSFDSILTTSLFFCPANGLRMPFNPTLHRRRRSNCGCRASSEIPRSECCCFDPDPDFDHLSTPIMVFIFTIFQPPILIFAIFRPWSWFLFSPSSHDVGEVRIQPLLYHLFCNLGFVLKAILVTSSLYSKSHFLAV